MTSAAPKRSLFSKPSWATTTAPIAKTDDNAVFGRGQIYEDIIAEQKKKKEKQAARAKARGGSDGRDSKRRRISQDHEDDSDSDAASNKSVHSEESQENVERAGPRTRSTPTKKKFAAVLDSPVKPKVSKPQAEATPILLDDDDDVRITATITAVKSTKGSTKPKPVVDEFDSDPESEDDDEYTRDLKRRARERARSQQQAATTTISQVAPSESMTESVELSQEGPGAQGKKEQDDDRKIRILITTLYPGIDPLIVTYSASRPLGRVKEGWCYQRRIPEEKAKTFFFVWNGAKLYDSSNLMKALEQLKRKRPDEEDPSKGDIHIEAMNAEIWEHRRAQKERVEAEAADPAEQNGKEATPEKAAPPSEPRVVIKLHAEGREPVPIKVKTSTQIGKIMQGCAQLMKVEEGEVCWLYFDGERLEPHTTVQDAELETGDIVEVTIV
jgi:Ubiquitin-2 like Rad60 SUMO-like